MNTKPRTILILAGLFLAGAASGAFLALRLAPQGHGRAQERRPFMERNMERMDRALAFTPEQRPQVEAVMRATGEELAKLRRDSREVTFQRIRSMNAKIEAMLTPAQSAKFADYQKEQFERMRRHQVERDQRGRSRSGDAPPSPEDMPEPPDNAPPAPPR
jgi:Spy/CpxP family protein refolding chaperone